MSNSMADVVARLPISYRQAHHWAAKGLLPGVDPDPGSGMPRVLTRAQVAHLTTMSHLVIAGCSPTSASIHATMLLETGRVDLGGRLSLQLERS